MINQEKDGSIKKKTGWENVPQFIERSKEHLASIPKFSLFEAPIRNTLPCKTINLMDLFFLIRNDFKEQTATLRACTSKEERRKIKANRFSYVTFSGIFSSRKDEGLIKHSGLLCLDFDHLKDVKVTRELLLDDRYFQTEMLFISPSGDGLKWVIKINLEEDNHLNWFLAISNYLKQTYKLEPDKAGKDISRACFLPNDPMLYLNPRY